MHVHKAVRLGSVVAVAVLLGAACSSSGPGQAAQGSGPPAGEVVWLGQTGSLQDAFDEVIIPTFQEEYPDLSVQAVPGGANDHLAKIRAQKNRPQASVIGGNALSHELGVREDLLAPLDPEVVVNLSETYEDSRYDDGVGAVVNHQIVGIVYNTDVFEEHGWQPPTSWKDLADPKYRGHVYGTDCSFSFTQYASLMIANAWGEGQDDTEGMRQGWSAIKENLGGVYPQAAQVEAQLGSGQAWIGWLSTARAGALARGGAPIAFVYPEEGAARFDNTADIVKDGPNQVGAQLFLNHLLSEQAQEAYATYSFMTPVRPDVYETLPSEVKEYVPSPEMLESDQVRAADMQYLTSGLDEIVNVCQQGLG